MTSPDTTLEASPIAAGEVVKLWLLHLLSLFFPLASLAFLWTGPHPWWTAPIFAAPLFVMNHFDKQSKVEIRQPHPDLPAWPFDGLVYLLAFLQLFIVYSVARMFEHQTILSVDMAMV